MQTVVIDFSVRVNVPVRLTCAVPYDENGKPDLARMEIDGCELDPLASVSVADVRESMSVQDFAYLDEAVHAALGEGT